MTQQCDDCLAQTGNTQKQVEPKHGILEMEEKFDDEIVDEFDEEMNKVKDKQTFLECERYIIFIALMCVGGFLGAYTYNLRGGVFSNAQTANFVLLSMAIGKGDWLKAGYVLIPMAAYLMGIILSEALPLKVRKTGFVRWDTLLVGVEVMITLFLGILPETVPYQITQVIISFICAMQFSTFREAQGIPMSTTFCTAHLRQIGVYSVKWFRKRERGYGMIAMKHIGMVGFFVIGGIISTILCKMFLGKAIWGATLILLIVFADLFYADLTYERSMLHQKPAGH